MTDWRIGCATRTARWGDCRPETTQRLRRTGLDGGAGQRALTPVVAAVRARPQARSRCVGVALVLTDGARRAGSTTAAV